ncbi:MAG: matrixin family metalloprotease [Clostridia bacterium]|nr:matrixin family metalloprotease [Clostridia bacterium]
MKKRIKCIGMVLFAFAIALSMSTGVYAYRVLGGRFVLTNGLRMTYEIDYETIQDEELIDIIHEAFDDWEWHLNDAVDGINMGAYFSHFMYEGRVADIRIRAVPDVYVDGRIYPARTDLYDANGRLVYGDDLANTNWVRAEIVIGYSQFNGLEPIEKKSTITHEIGHVLGLAHNTDNGTIMYDRVEGCTAYVPTLDDIEGVYSIYCDLLE